MPAPRRYHKWKRGYISFQEFTRIRKMVAAGYGTDRIAKEFGHIDRDSLEKAVARSKQPVTSYRERKEIYSELQTGAAVHEVAANRGISVPAVVWVRDNFQPTP